MKIVITGGLGYLGTELCHLYSGEARYKHIVVVDNRFISERVRQLSDWGMTFIQGDITDIPFLRKVLEGADIVYHLAGETNVAYTRTESSEELDKRIRVYGVEATRKVIGSCPRNAKLVFPSTHVVFEGLPDTKFDITEKEPVSPELTYAIGKAQSEVDIQKSGLDYIIFRLGSVYGYSTDTMRIGIMPNLFSKMAAQNSNISLYSGGKQWKSLVCIHDVVRAMKEFSEGDYHKELYHFSNENMTVREVAEICQKVNPSIQLTVTDDEVPNLGYTLSNKKLLATGFQFRYSIEQSIREMIINWTRKEQPIELEYILRGQKEFIDGRGKISNYELPEPINLIGLIYSITGSVRANHYHPIQQQKCLLISGRYVSATKDLSIPDAPIEYKVIYPGDIAVIQPNVAHTMVFLQNSVFLNLVRGEREHENYGITHTIPYQLVDDKMKFDILTSYRNTCRGCGGTELKPVISLGMSPLANNLLDTADQACDMYPLEMEWCPNCYNCQLSVVVPAGKMFDNYLYVSSTSATFRKHFEDAADKYIQEFNLNSNSLVVDIGSNDGVFLKPLQERGIRVVGVEPALNLVEVSRTNGVPAVRGYFDKDMASRIYSELGSPDLITASNVFAHADDLEGIARAAIELLKPEGTFIIEVQYLMDTIKDLTFDNIYHEHVNYWSVTSLVNFFTRLGYSLFHVEHINTHGGSIRCYIGKTQGPDDTVQEFLWKEELEGVNSYGTYQLFAQRVEQLKATVQKNIKLLKEKFPVIAAYGAPAKATTALNYFGITGKDIAYTIEDNDMKVGKIIPGVNIPINSKKNAPGYKAPDLVIVLAWNFYDSIVENHKYLNANFISIKDLEIPEMPILDTQVWELKGEPVTGKVYDCFIFYNELDLLELRLNIMDPVVDHFVIVEAATTHSGDPKPFYYEENRERFSKWADKIIYIQLQLPDDYSNLPIHQSPVGYDQQCWNQIVADINRTDIMDKTNPRHGREFFQRESIILGLENCKYEDIIMLSDLDEIANPDTVKALLQNFDPERVYGLRQNSYYYKLNLLKEIHWVGQRIATYKRFLQQAPGSFRHIRDILIANGGWHFSFQGNKEQVAQKLLAYSHSDMATEDVMEQLQNRIDTAIDPFNRGKLKRVEIDNTYPQYILDNLEQYNYMIL